MYQINDLVNNKNNWVTISFDKNTIGELLFVYIILLTVLKTNKLLIL